MYLNGQGVEKDRYIKAAMAGHPRQDISLACWSTETKIMTEQFRITLFPREDSIKALTECYKDGISKSKKKILQMLSMHTRLRLMG